MRVRILNNNRNPVGLYSIIEYNTRANSRPRWAVVDRIHTDEKYNVTHYLVLGIPGLLDPAWSPEFLGENRIDIGEPESQKIYGIYEIDEEEIALILLKLS